jgi:hypothetical protein
MFFVGEEAALAFKKRIFCGNGDFCAILPVIGLGHRSDREQIRVEIRVFGV